MESIQRIVKKYNLKMPRGYGLCFESTKSKKGHYVIRILFPGNSSVERPFSTCKEFESFAMKFIYEHTTYCKHCKMFFADDGEFARCHNTRDEFGSSDCPL